MGQMTVDYTGATVFVAGGTSGINLGIAEGFAAAGARPEPWVSTRRWPGQAPLVGAVSRTALAAELGGVLDARVGAVRPGRPTVPRRGAAGPTISCGGVPRFGAAGAVRSR